MDNLKNELEIYDVESNGVLSPEDIDGVLFQEDIDGQGGEEDLVSQDDDSMDKEDIIFPEHNLAKRSAGAPLEFGVNKSKYNINVRKGAGKSYAKVATMKKGESFGFTGSKKRDSQGYDWYKIKILSPKGKWISGWYRGMTGVSYWKNNPYKKEGNIQYYKLREATSLYTPGADHMTKLRAGDQIYCRNRESSGKSGSSYQDYMLCHGIRCKNGDEMPISVFSVGQDYARISYAYIDTQMMHGASHIKGNW